MNTFMLKTGILNYSLSSFCVKTILSILLMVISFQMFQTSSVNADPLQSNKKSYPAKATCPKGTLLMKDGPIDWWRVKPTNEKRSGCYRSNNPTHGSNDPTYFTRQSSIKLVCRSGYTLSGKTCYLKGNAPKSPNSNGPKAGQEIEKCKDNGGKWVVVNKYKQYCSYPKGSKGWCIAKGGKWEERTSGGRCVYNQATAQEKTCEARGMTYDKVRGSCKLPCTSGEKVYDNDKKRCVAKNSANSGVHPNAAECAMLGRKWDGNKCAQTCKQSGYSIVNGTPYNKCVKGGGGGSSSGGTSKAKASCAAAHKVWSNGKCTNVCKGGYAHTKNKPNACVIVAKTDDKTAPTVEIVAPSEGTTIKEHAEIKATAKDNVAVSSVEFYRSGPSGSSQTGSAIPQKLATDTSEPYSVQWNTTKLQNGTYSLTAVAFDSNGNKTTSDPVSVIIDNNSQAANHSHIAVTLEDESTVDVDLTGNCYKELKGNRMPIPQKFADEDVVASLSFTATCVTPGDSTEVGLTLADIYEEGDLKVYTQTGATITDITDKVVFTRDNNEETTTVTYSITDGGNGDNDAKKDGKVLGAVILVASDGSSGTGSGTGSGTTSSSSQSGSQTTTNADGTKVTTDANGNTYAAGKGASSLPNTGTSSVVGIMAIVGGLAAAVVYAIARKRGLHKPNL